MRLPEFCIQLLTRFAPVSKESLSSLNIELSTHFATAVNSFKSKEELNKQTLERISKLEFELNQLDPHDDAHERKLSEMETLKKQLETPTFLEKLFAALDKPLVRLALMAGFSLLSWWIARKITGASKKKDEEDEFDEQAQFVQQQPQRPYYNNNNYNPYGYGGYPPPPPPYGYQNQYPPQGYPQNKH